MARGVGLPQSPGRRDGLVMRALRALVLGVTLLFVLLFAVLSAQIALNWFLWKDDEE